LVDSQDLGKIDAYLKQPGVGIDDRPDDFQTLLDFAAERNQVKVAQYLIDHRADVNGTPQGKQASSNPAGTTPLCRAADFNALETLDLLIRRGADVNSLPGRASTLTYAARMGNLKAVDILLAHGADINQTFGMNQSAISLALQSGRVDVAHYLASHGATLGASGLYLATQAGSPDLVGLALESNFLPAVVDFTTHSINDKLLTCCEGDVALDGVLDDKMGRGINQTFPVLTPPLSARRSLPRIDGMSGSAAPL
jgi:ankyrin repeat protein